jgi:MoaA/NifB/PqqE/SkfB family radical SAM enzyme
MCDSWRKPPEEELSLAEVRRIFAGIGRLDVVKISGGEPFVRADLGEIIATVDELCRPEFVHLTTNGTLTDRVVGTLTAVRPRARLHVRVSIDGLGAEHDRVRGARDAYRRAMAAVDALASLPPPHRADLAVNQTIVDGAGLRDYPALRRELARRGVRLIPSLAQASLTLDRVGRDRVDRPADGASYATFGAFGADELRAFFQDAEADAATLPSPVVRAAMRYYLRGLRRRRLEHRADPSPPCRALADFFRILPNGDVPICFNDARVVGNLRAAGFRALWAGPARAQARRIVRSCPGCWSGCEVIPSAVYSGDLARWLVVERLRKT